MLKIRAIALSCQVQNHEPKIWYQVGVCINGITKNSAIGQMKNAVRGDAICSTLWEKPKTLHCLSNGTTFCKIVCSAASIYGWSDINKKSQTVVRIIDVMLVKNIQTIHRITLTRSNVFIGFFQSHHFVIKSPQIINQKLKNHQINHQTSTDTKESQYGSISDIKTQPRKLLNIEKNINQ